MITNSKLINQSVLRYVTSCLQRDVNKAMAATATVVRVKRRLEDDPVDSLLLVCKKVRSDAADIGCASVSQDDSAEAVKSVFKFAGTVTGPVSPSCEGAMIATLSH